MRDIACEIVRDLLPTYVDGLASDDTKQIVEEHIAHCGECRHAFNVIRAERIFREDGEMKELAFLRRERKKNRRAFARRRLY